MSMLHKKRFSKTYFVILAVTSLTSSKPAFFSHLDSLEPESYLGNSDFLDLERGWEELLQAVGPPAAQHPPATLMTQSTEQQVAAALDQVSTFHANRPSIFSWPANGNDTPSIDLGGPAHQIGAVEQFTDPSSFYQKLEHRTDVTADVGVMTADRPQSFYMRSEFADAGVPPSWNSISDPQRFSDSARFPAVYNLWKQGGGLITEQSPECSQLSATDSLGSLFEPFKGQSQDSFDGFAKMFQAVEVPLLPQYNRQALKRNRSTHYHEKNTHQIKPMAKGRTLSSKAEPCDMTGDAQPSFNTALNMKDDECQHESKKAKTKASKLAEAQTQVHYSKNELLNQLLEPEKHGYINSLKSFIRFIMSPQIQPDSSLIFHFWLKETDAQELFCVWERAKLPYPRPLDISSIRRTHVSKQLLDIASMEIESSCISQSIDKLAESFTKCMNVNKSKHTEFCFSMKFKKGEFGKGLISKVRNSTSGALFLIRIINSIFPKYGYFMPSREEDSIKAWEFFQRFWNNFSYFQPDLKQNHNGVSFPVKKSPYPTQILNNIGKNITRMNHPRENLDLSWLLVETWVSDQRPSLYLQMGQNGGKMDRRFKAIIHQFITYIRPNLSKPPKEQIKAR